MALLGANAISEFGNVLAALAIPWFVLQTTGSAAKTGIAAGATVTAFVLAGFFGGPAVDRIGLKRTSVLSDLASGASVAMVPLLYQTVGISFWQLLTLVFLGAFLDAPGKAARQGLLPELAAEAGTPIERANSAYQAVGRSAQLLGPPLAGLLIVTLGAGMVLWIDAATFVASAAITASAVPALAQSTQRDAPKAGYAAELAEGLKFIRRDSLVFWIVVTFTFTELLDAPLVSVVLPVYANEVFESALGLGGMMAALGAGALAGSVAYGFVGHRLPRRATFVASFAALQVPFWLLAFAPSVIGAMVALALAGVAAGPLNALLYTVVQERTPAEMRGRVFGAFSATAMAAVPIGMVLCGYLLEIAGLRVTLIGAAACYLAVTATLLCNPALRNMEKGGEAAPDTAASLAAEKPD